MLLLVISLQIGKVDVSVVHEIANSWFAFYLNIDLFSVLYRDYDTVAKIDVIAS